MREGLKLTDLNQMVVGVVLNEEDKPIYCEMWPGNTADVKTLIPVVDRIRKRSISLPSVEPEFLR